MLIFRKKEAPSFLPRFKKKRGPEMGVKIIIKRKVLKGKEAQMAPLPRDLRSRAITQSGYITGGALRNVNDPEEYVVIGTWKSVEDWKAWEASKERAEMQSRIDALLRVKTDYGSIFMGKR
jgi:heme-degrading monooxygenase HmoA